MKELILQENIPKEGKLYKIVDIKGVKFELYYGYYDEVDKSNNNLNVIYPNLLTNPAYTKEGLPIVTMMQDPCRYVESQDDVYFDCGLCKYFERVEEFFGVCKCSKNKKKQEIRL